MADTSNLGARDILVHYDNDGDEASYLIDGSVEVCETYGQMRKHLVEQEGVLAAANMQLYDEEGHLLLDNDPIDYDVKNVYLRPFDGEEVDAEGQEEEDEIVNVSIYDHKCDTEMIVMPCDPNSTVEQLLVRYCDEARRHLHRNAENMVLSKLSYESKMHEPIPLMMLVRDLELNDDRKVLVYEAPAYQIVLKESDTKSASGAETSLEVYDHMTVEQVKEMYSREADEGLVEGDNLVMNKQDLENSKELYKYKLHAATVLKVEREDFSSMHFIYLCADCGSDVRLKKEDLVRCRECGYRVVYKQRTKKDCQYLAR